MKTNFSSAFGPVIDRYITLKQSLGRSYMTETKILSLLDRFLVSGRNRFNDLTAEAFREWCKTLGKMSSGGRRMRMRLVRNVCLYRRRFEPDCFVPDSLIFPHKHQPIRPYILSVAEVQRLIDQTFHLARNPHSPLRPELFRLVIVLLFTTGLRHRELLRLTVRDYSSREGTLLIRASKFHKSRLLPLRTDVCREVENYLEALRRWHSPVTADTPLFWNRYNGGRAYSSRILLHNVRQLLKMANIQCLDGRFPRIHDFRHSFAVNVLRRWYQSGVDVQSKLPFLAAYMGHVDIVSTYYYLHFVEPLPSLASARFRKHYAAVVNPAAKKREVRNEIQIS